MNWTFAKVRKFYVYVGIIIGIGFYASLRMFLTDMMGMERYIEYIRGHWIDMSPLWGLFATIFWIYIAWWARR